MTKDIFYFLVQQYFYQSFLKFLKLKTLSLFDQSSKVNFGQVESLSSSFVKSLYKQFYSFMDESFKHNVKIKYFSQTLD